MSAADRLVLIPRSGRVRQPLDGTYMFVDYGVAKEPWHERFVLRVVEEQTCVVLTPDGEVLRETQDSPPFRQVVHATSAHNLPVLLGRKQDHPVYRFERAVSDARSCSLEDKIDLESKKSCVSKFDIGSLSKSDAPSSPATPRLRITSKSPPAKGKTPPTTKSPKSPAVSAAFGWITVTVHAFA